MDIRKVDIKKLAPWNWFKKEEEEGRAHVPVHYQGGDPAWGSLAPFFELHREMDRMFDRFLRGFGFPSLFSEGLLAPLHDSGGLLKPRVDIGASDNEYTISVEVPGVSEDDIRVEVADNTLTVTGEKRQEKEEKRRDYYRIERSYGTFRRVLSLPDDAVQDDIKAAFANGVLTITVPRKAAAGKKTREIEIRKAA
jgi:HSP20 family protein